MYIFIYILYVCIHNESYTSIYIFSTNACTPPWMIMDTSVSQCGTCTFFFPLWFEWHVANFCVPVPVSCATPTQQLQCLLLLGTGACNGLKVGFFDNPSWPKATKLYDTHVPLTWFVPRICRFRVTSSVRYEMPRPCTCHMNCRRIGLSNPKSLQYTLED